MQSTTEAPAVPEPPSLEEGANASGRGSPSLEAQEVLSDEAWIQSRKAGLPKGLHFAMRSSGLGRYEFYLPKLFRGRYRNTWGELHKIEAIREYKRFKIEYNRVRVSKSKRQRDNVRRMAIRREELYYADKAKRSKAKRARVDSKAEMPGIQGRETVRMAAASATSSSSTTSTPTTPQTSMLMSPHDPADEDWLRGAFEVPENSTLRVSDDVLRLCTTVDILS